MITQLDAELPPLPEPDGYLEINLIGRSIAVDGYRSSTVRAAQREAFEAGVRAARQPAPPAFGLVLGLADVDAAFEAEIHRVSHQEYASDDICRWFFSNVRNRLAALIQPQDDLARSSSEAPAVQAQQHSLPLDEALSHLQGLVEFAYAQGFHELGYDPLKVVREALPQPPQGGSEGQP